MLATVSRSDYRAGSVILVRMVKAFTDPTHIYPSYIDVNYVAPPLQVMYEEMTPNSSGSHRQWKSFQHFRSAVLGDPPMSKVPIVAYYAGAVSKPYEGEVDYPYYCYWENTRYGVPHLLDQNPNLAALYVKDAGGGFVPIPAALDELKQRSLNTMLPYIKSELSLMNSIYEIKDWPSIVPTIAKTKAFAEVLLKTGKSNVRGFLRVGADNFLQWMFNINPLLSDLSGIHTALTRLERRLNALITRAGRVQNMHFAYNWNEFPDLVSDIPNWNSTNQLTAALAAVNLVGPTSTVRYQRYVTYSPSRFHAEIRYNYNYSDYQLVHAQALGLLDSLGVNYNPRIIWAAIPWSFVVDWVVGVGRLLDQFKVRQMEPQINIQGYLWSVTRERRVLVTRQVLDSQLPDRGPQGKRSIIPLPVVVSKAYRRSVGLPLSSSVTLSGLSPMEFTLGAAMVLSQGRHHKH